MHMGHTDERRFPDFTFIAPKGESLTPHVDCVIISHFHLDHCGALPFMTEMAGYDGPIYMTHPTKAICPLLLEDMRKIAADFKKEQGFFTQQMIKDSMKKVIAVNLHETVRLLILMRILMTILFVLSIESRGMTAKKILKLFKNFRNF